MRTQKPQTPTTEWQIDVWWFHFFRSLIDGGQLAKMSGAACKVYLVIKSHANFKTGFAEPALVTIAQKSGLSLATVKREIRSLCNSGLVRKQKSGRHNVYLIIEHFPLVGPDGTPVAIGRCDYLPGKVSAATEELKQSAATQSITNTSLICIDKLQVQVIGPNGHGIQFGDINMESWSGDLRAAFQRILDARAKREGTPDEEDI